jgi:WD40 repeat protein
LPAQHRSAGALAITPDNHYLLAATDSVIRIWNVANSSEIEVLKGHQERITCLAIAPNGEFGVSGSQDKTIKIWDVRQWVALRTIAGHDKLVTALAVTADSRHIISASADKTIKVWRVDTGELYRHLATIEETLIHAKQLAITPDNRLLLAGGAFSFRIGWLAAFRLQGDTQIQFLLGRSNGVSGLAITRNARYAVWVSEFDQKFVVWDLVEQRSVAEFDTDSQLSACAVAADGRTIVGGGANGELYCLYLEGLPVHTEAVLLPIDPQPATPTIPIPPPPLPTPTAKPPATGGRESELVATSLAFSTAILADQHQQLQ